MGISGAAEAVLRAASALGAGVGVGTTAGAVRADATSSGLGSGGSAGSGGDGAGGSRGSGTADTEEGLAAGSAVSLGRTAEAVLGAAGTSLADVALSTTASTVGADDTGGGSSAGDGDNDLGGGGGRGRGALGLVPVGLRVAKALTDGDGVQVVLLDDAQELGDEVLSGVLVNLLGC